MHRTVPFKNPVHLVHVDRGIVYTFKSFKSLVARWAEFRRHDIGPGPSHKKTWPTPDAWATDFRRLRCRAGKQEEMKYHHDYILRDSTGTVLDPKNVHDLYNARRPYYSYLGYPNPCHSGSKRGGYHYYRHPRTTQERRWAAAWNDEEFAPKCRAARNYHNLPNAWDDLGRSDWEDRNWKGYRKHQWKG